MKKNKKIKILNGRMKTLNKKLKLIKQNIEIQNGSMYLPHIYKQVFENSVIGNALVDLDGNFIKVNNALCEMIGYSKKELLEKNFKNITYKDDLELNLMRLNELLNNIIPYYRLEKRYICKNGTLVWVDITTSLLRDKNRKPLYIISQIQDISKIKKVNDALEYEKLKTEFFANISHELRTPINIILNSIHLIDKRCNQVLQCEKSNKYLNIMKQNCYRLIRIINNLIDTTKIDVKYANINLKNHNIVRIIEDITLSITEYTNNKNIKLVFDTDVEEKIMACDPDRIERIILNLLSNAIKFTPQGGTINVNINDKKKYLIVVVKDTGIGIKKDKLNSIFDRFGQIDKSLTRNYEGSGIGLSLVKSFVEMHGGSICVKSRYGSGSEFIIKLPKRLVSDNCDIIHEGNTPDIINKYKEMINIEFSDIYFSN